MKLKKKYYSNMLKNCSDTKNTWNVFNNYLHVKNSNFKCEYCKFLNKFLII